MSAHQKLLKNTLKGTRILFDGHGSNGIFKRYHSKPANNFFFSEKDICHSREKFWPDTKFIWSDNFIVICIIVMYTVLSLTMPQETPTLYIVTDVWHHETFEICFRLFLVDLSGKTKLSPVRMPNLADICSMTSYFFASLHSKCTYGKLHYKNF